MKRREALKLLAGAAAGTALPFIGTAFVTAAEGAKPSVSKIPFRYRNPVEGPIIRDPQIVRHDGLYYMTGTFPPFWGERESPGVRIVKSKDLLHWSEPKVVLPPGGWFKSPFWAPEIFPYAGRFYLTFNSFPNGQVLLNDSSDLFVGLAVSDQIEGPYQPITKNGPLVEGNDATLFLDRDGKIYLYHATAFDGRSAIGCTEVDLRRGVVMGQTTPCITVGSASDWDGGAKVGVEGPSVFRRGSTYYLLYASWGRGYEVGYATAPGPRGPWRKSPKNPIYGAQNPELAAKYGKTVTQAKEIPFGEVGHGSPFFGPGGQIWFGCHGIELKGRGPDVDPHLVLAPMRFGSDGSIEMKLTWTPQVSAAKTADPYWRPSGTPAAYAYRT